MKIVNFHQAKTQLSRLLARRREPAARLVPEDFLEPLSEDESKGWDDA